MKQFCKLLPVCLMLGLSGCGMKQDSYRYVSCENTEFAGDEEEETLSEQIEGTGAEEITKTQEDDQTELETKTQDIYVYLCGAVSNPGVYTLPEGSRLYQAVELAGGLSNQAEPRALNLAQELRDGDMITVFTVEEVAATGGITPEPMQSLREETGETGPGMVNLNTADVAELMTLPGIGEAKATAILAYRQEHGFFTAIEDLMQISGIKEGVFVQIRDRICV